MLAIKNVSKKYNDIAILDDISFSVQDNQIVGLAGPSGGGKSTLLRCIQDLETIDQGEINTNLKCGFMFQDFQLFPHMTVLQNLAYAPTLEDTTKDHTKRAFEILEDLNIIDKADEYPKRLSGGQKQRVALARSLMMSPTLLLCDEPTSGLDVATVEDVVILLESIRKKGVTMLIASHDLDFLTQVADRIILLKNGKIAFDADAKNIDDPIHVLKNYY
ncbi:MAG: amino acid ABC transporter ATP-binding protein [Proteobacteria bacterium]|nr:amino acid ABC transporter ATP-binding protein [Pseudomonadota bacterium]